jgi:FkbM family methyltransferase
MVERLVARIERGMMRKLPPAVVMAANAMLHQRLGEPELHELKRLVRPGTIAVDVGAHFGVYSYVLARLVGKEGRVIAIEPIAEDADLIDRAARTLRLPISVVRCALSSREGEATLRIPRLGGAEKTALATLEGEPQAGDAGAMDERVVPVRRLDDVLDGIDLPVSFLKIDVEGHELAVLEGAARTITTHRPVILIEINHDLGGRPVEAVFDRILGFGYHGEFLEGGKERRPLSDFDVTMHQVVASGDVLSKDYVNNFIFIPA